MFVRLTMLTPIRLLTATTLGCALASLVAAGCGRAARAEEAYAAVLSSHASTLQHPEAATPSQIMLAVEALTAIPPLAPGSQLAAQAIEQIGLMHLARRDTAGARRAFNEVFWSYFPHRGTALMALVYIGRSHELDGNWIEATKAYRRITDYHAWHPIWLDGPLYIADMHLRRKDLPAAREAYQDAVGLLRRRLHNAPGPVQRLQVRTRLLIAYRALGDVAQAHVLHEELLAEGRDAQDPDTLLEFARTCRDSLDEPALTRRTYERLLNQFPQHALAAVARHELQQLPPPLGAPPEESIYLQ